MAHSHAHGSELTAGRMAMAVGLTGAFVVAEAAAGAISHSLALLSDAGHNFADALALVLCWYALYAAKKPSNARRTFGFHRVGIFAALVNAASLAVIAVLIFWEAVVRLRHPEPVRSGVMVGVAVAAILINGLITLWLHGGARNNLNVRSAYLHMLGDMVSAAGVVIAGFVVAATGASFADPIVSFLIGALIFWSSWGILVEAVDVLLESVPAGLDMASVEQAIDSVDGVMNVHDLHVWTVGPGVVACCCHILVAEQSVRSGQQVLRTVAELLERRFGITHATIQVEVEGCEANDMYCALRVHEHAGHTH